MTLMDTFDEYWTILDGMDWWIQLIVGLAAPVIAGTFVQQVAKGPVLNFITGPLATSWTNGPAITDAAKPTISWIHQSIPSSMVQYSSNVSIRSLESDVI